MKSDATQSNRMGEKSGCRVCLSITAKILAVILLVVGGCLSIPGMTKELDFPVENCDILPDSKVSCVMKSGMITCYEIDTCSSITDIPANECTDNVGSGLDLGEHALNNLILLGITAGGFLFLSCYLLTKSNDMCSCCGFFFWAGSCIALIFYWAMVMELVVKSFQVNDGSIDAGCSESIGVDQGYLKDLRMTLASSLILLIVSSPFAVVGVFLILALFCAILNDKCKGDGRSNKNREEVVGYLLIVIE